MKLTINTLKFQEMLTKAIRGAKNDPRLPLTQIIYVKVKDGVLSLTTTDMNNYLVVRDEINTQDNFEVAIYADTFYKLVTKLTSDLIVLELKNSYLEITGDGVYKLELFLDETGTPLKLVNPIDGMPKTSKVASINSSTIRRILSGIKQSLSISANKEDSARDCYSRYHVGSNVVASNGYVVSVLNTKVFDNPKLFTTDLMNLLGVVTDDELVVYSNTKINNAGNEVRELLFESEHYSIYGIEVDGIDEFDINAINGWLSQEFPSHCKLSRNVLVKLLDRISLFVERLDNDAVALTFTNNELLVSSMASTGVESIKYLASNDHKDFTCSISIKLLALQLASQTGDSIELWYGDDGAIKLVDDDITSIIGLGV